jgi:heme/copper-type cytochrome/quinol oxidase subunit 1
MFKRLVYEEWHQVLPVLSFILTFIVFAVLFVRALLMRRDRAQHLALLPLETQGEGRRYE